MSILNKDNKKFVAESIFIKEAIKDNLSLNEFLLLLYFDNSYNQVFDMSMISKLMNLSEDKVLEAYSNLLKKKLIRVSAVKNDSGKIFIVFLKRSLVELYRKWIMKLLMLGLKKALVRI